MRPRSHTFFFALLLKHAFSSTTEGIYLRTRSDCRLFNLARLRAKTKVREVLIRDMLFADDAAVATHTQREHQSLMDRFSQACKDFGLTISLKKTNVLGQSTETPLSITIDDYELDAVHQFTYLGSTITDNLSLDAEIDKRIGKAARTHARLTTRVWTNPKLTVKTKMAVYNACVISTLLYCSEAWTTYARLEGKATEYTFDFGLHTALFHTGEPALIRVMPEVINSKHLQHKVSFCTGIIDLLSDFQRKIRYLCICNLEICIYLT